MTVRFDFANTMGETVVIQYYKKYFAVHFSFPVPVQSHVANIIRNFLDKREARYRFQPMIVLNHNSFIFLSGDPRNEVRPLTSVLKEYYVVKNDQGHFVPEKAIDSQLETIRGIEEKLEPPDDDGCPEGGIIGFAIGPDGPIAPQDLPDDMKDHLKNMGLPPGMFGPPPEDYYDEEEDDEDS